MTAFEVADLSQVCAISAKAKVLLYSWYTAGLMLKIMCLHLFLKKINRAFSLSFIHDWVVFCQNTIDRLRRGITECEYPALCWPLRNDKAVHHQIQIKIESLHPRPLSSTPAAFYSSGVTVHEGQIKEQRARAMTGLYILRACALTSDSLPTLQHYAPSADAMWTDSMLSPCRVLAMHYVQLLSYAIAPCISQLLSGAEAYSEQRWLSELEPLTAKRAQSADWERARRVEECVVSALPPRWRIRFFISAGVTRSGGGIAFRTALPLTGTGIPVKNESTAQMPSENVWHYLSERYCKANRCLLL